MAVWFLVFIFFENILNHSFDIRAFNTRDHFLVSFASGRKEARVIGIFCASFIASENASSVVCLGSKFLSRCLGL